MKHCCINCHFLSKEYPEPNTGRRLTFSLNKDERKKAANGDFDFINEMFCLNCQMCVWDEGVNSDRNSRLKRINEINRHEKCFFYRYNSSMLFDAAVELQKREQENNQLKKSNRYTQFGLWIAALGLIANAIIGYCSFQK